MFPTANPFTIGDFLLNEAATSGAFKARAVASCVALAAFVSGCGEEMPPLPELEVDTTMVQAAEVLPQLDGSSPRAVATIESENGIRSQFVSNELWVTTDDDDALAMFVARWDGVVLMTLDPETRGLEGSGLPRRHLVRIDTSLADTTELALDLQALDQNATGRHRISSDQGLELLAAATAEAFSELRVDINWVGNSADFGAALEGVEAPDLDPNFDEADGLLGKRGEIRDSHDRYANTETAY